MLLPLIVKHLLLLPHCPLILGCTCPTITTLLGKCCLISTVGRYRSPLLNNTRPDTPLKLVCSRKLFRSLQNSNYWLSWEVNRSHGTVAFCCMFYMEGCSQLTKYHNHLCQRNNWRSLFLIYSCPFQEIKTNTPFCALRKLAQHPLNCKRRIRFIHAEHWQLQWCALKKKFWKSLRCTKSHLLYRDSEESVFIQKDRKKKSCLSHCKFATTATSYINLSAGL